jgi:hypothetical protein
MPPRDLAAAHAASTDDARRRCAWILRKHPDLADDLGQEAWLACRTMADDGVLDDASMDAVARHLSAYLHAELRSRSLPMLAERIAPAPATEADVPPPRPRKLTPGQRKRMARNIAIASASRAGMSQRMLAATFGLARARIGAILAEMSVPAERSPIEAQP